MKHILLVGLGGMTGSILRYLSNILIKQSQFPIATFSVNIIGSLIIGLVMGWAIKQPESGNWQLFLATGICGGFTTFSAFAWENLQLLNQQRYLHFAIYAGGSFILSIIAVTFGYWLTNKSIL